MMLSRTRAASFGSRCTASRIFSWSETNAKGSSPEYSSGAAMTHTSAMSGWSSRWPSSSAGATIKGVNETVSM